MTKRRTAILILGMHRSGTSALTRVLNLCGVDLGRRLMPPAAGNNDNGFWEHLEAVELHEQLLVALGRSWSDPRSLPQGWQQTPAAAVAAQRIAALLMTEFAASALWAIKDPRLCRFVPLWIKILEDAGIDVRVVFVLRHPDEVVASLSRRDGMSPHEAGLLSLNHFFEAALATVGQRRSVVTYQGLMEDWRGCVGRIAQELGLDLDVVAGEAEIGRFLDRGARNHHAADDASALRESLNGRVYGLARSSADSAAFWDGVVTLGEIWDLYRHDVLPYADELLDLLAARDAVERVDRGVTGITPAGNDAAVPALARLQFRMITGLQDGLGRLGQASADLGAMVRTGTEAALGAASDIAGTVNALRENLPQVISRLDGIAGQATNLSLLATHQQQQIIDALIQADVLRRHIDAVALRGEAQLGEFAVSSVERLDGLAKQAMEAAAAAAAAAEREHALLARIHALGSAVEALGAAAAAAADRERERDEGRWSRRLRRLLSGK